MNASVAIQVLPKVGRDETIRIVDEVIAYIKFTGLHYVVGPFETTIEGDYDALMDIVKRISSAADDMIQASKDLKGIVDGDKESESQ